jgi:hypothetical protein
MDSSTSSSGICHNWARGNGYCKYGPNCNFKHEGPQGGGKRKDPFTSLLTSGNSKKARKKIVSLLINDFKESMSQDGSTLGRTKGEKRRNLMLTTIMSIVF